MDIHSKVRLNNGVEMPILGLGVYQTPSGSPTRNACLYALEAGYRLIDTAKLYGNERDVGLAVRESGLPREDVFITTKVWNTDHGFDKTLRACERSLRELGMDFVDLYLIHWPGGGFREETWKAMEEILRTGKARAIGVSNYTTRHLDEMLSYARTSPAVNQVEFHPWLYQEDLLSYCGSKGIQMEAYSPLTQGSRLDDRALAGIATRYGRSPAQVLIRWGLQHGLVLIPKSTHKDRILENSRVFDFELSAEDMNTLDRLGQAGRVSWNPNSVR